MKRLILLALVVGLAAAIRYLPWWATTGSIVAVPLIAWTLFKRKVTQFFLGAFKAKSAVLAGATARILSIEPAPPFKPEDEEDADLLLSDLEDPHHWVFIELEITVAEQTDSPMNLWEPDSLAIVSAQADPDDFESDEEVGHVYGAEAMESGEWVAVDGKLSGSQRLRLHVAAREGVDRFRLRYFFELLQNVG